MILNLSNMKQFLLLLLCTFSLNGFAQLTSSGDIAFVDFNADAEDDFSIVTFVDIPANTTIYFSDKEWDGTQFNTGESNWSWNTGSTIIPAGTVVVFNRISDGARSITFGSYAEGTPGGISASSEALFAYLGSDASTPTTFLAAVANSSGAFGSLENTGLSLNLTATVYTEGADIAAYKGPRTGLGKNGYQQALNDFNNYDIQDDGGDQSADATVPDLPFSTIAFQISATDVTPPSVASVNVIDQNSLSVNFSEDVTEASATNQANYNFDPALNIISITYDAASLSSTVSHEGFIIGRGYQLTVQNLSDIDGNVQSDEYISDNLYFNPLSGGLIITEIMYNVPGSTDDDDLEFVEVYNNTTASISLGGLRFNDSSGTGVTLAENELAAGALILIAINKAFADSFYGQTFMDINLPATNVFGNGGELLSISNSQGTEIFSVDYDDASPWPTGPDGDGPSLELLDPTKSADDGSNWRASTNLIGQSEGFDILASPGTFTPVIATMPAIGFDLEFDSVNENSGSTSLNVSLDRLPDSGTVTVSLVAATGSTAVENTDFTLSSNSLTFTSTGALTQTVTLNVIDNTVAGPDVFAAIQLDNLQGATLGTNAITVRYILDDETHTPTALNTLGMQYAGSYSITGADPGAEIVAHDPVSNRLFVMNSGAAIVEILDFSNPLSVVSIASIDLSTETIGAMAGDAIEGTSVTAKNGVMAATSIRVENAAGDGLFEPGTVTFMDIDGVILSSVAVGVLPDMITFTPDGTKVLVANEAQPSDDYQTDPEGTISVIDLTGGISTLDDTNVTTINFNAFDADIASLRASGVRIFGPNATVSQDFEPEYITVSDDSQTAWVSLQENNAVARVNLSTNEITDILPLGLKDHSLPENALDVNDESDFIYFGNWPVGGMYMPDAIATYNVGGVDYIVTANEGDARDYDGFSEEANITDAGYDLDPAVFTDQDILRMSSALSEIKVTTATGDINGDGLYEEIHVFGGRSFSIFNGTTGALVYDSADDMERIIAADPVYSAIFNASNSNNNFKNRSDDKGPEPEGVVVKQINGSTYAFIGLERVGGIMVYDITDPAAPVYQSYVNNRGAVEGANESGDLGPEGLIYIAPEENTLAKGLIVVANEVSATLSIYSLENNTLSLASTPEKNKGLKLYPNPSNAGQPVYFEKPTAYELYDITGRMIARKSKSAYISTESLSTGMYLVKVGSTSAKILVK